MKYSWLIVYCSVILILTKVSFAQSIPIVTWKQIHQNVLNSQNDTIYVINFWATWCKPCIEELPAFVKLHDSSGLPVKVVFASMDFKKDLLTKLQPFVQKRNIKADVVLVSEPDQEKFINSVSQDWSGSLPATIILNTKKNIRLFYERQFTYSELVDIINNLIYK